eukprot:TRINITY_DN27212_c0_g1_i1.p1 TRINITY_DN27212_c0_g1~~TRINITY_DN27212_c0_g1_i1.p1  ORF type:complete len:379 (-),score=65.41 TRINITY_DN27212_c0_g1_i1:89-1183(-)
MMTRSDALIICSVLLHVVSAQPACRDRTLWPFSNDSIWNMPIGSNAQYVAAGIYSIFPPPESFHNDQDFFVVASNSDPMTPWVSQGDWSNSNHCAVVGQVADKIPFPYEFTTSCVLNNNAAGLLLPDNRTLLQMQPLYRAAPGSPVLAQYHQGCPQPFPWSMDILGSGALGAHGGSGLSAVGGTIRLGELLNSTGPIRHALKLELYAHEYYYGGNASACYTWPAVGCDSYHLIPNIGYNGSNVFLKPGALLAIPPAIASKVVTTTVPGSKIKQALVDFGGYIVDDTACDTAAICMDYRVTAELEAVYGIGVDISNPTRPGSPFYDDLVAVFQALSVVSNNGPNSIGGGGTPRVSMAPPICGAYR